MVGPPWHIYIAIFQYFKTYMMRLFGIDLGKTCSTWPACMVWKSLRRCRRPLSVRSGPNKLQYIYICTLHAGTMMFQVLQHFFWSQQIYTPKLFSIFLLCSGSTFHHGWFNNFCLHILAAGACMRRQGLTGSCTRCQPAPLAALLSWAIWKSKMSELSIAFLKLIGS